MRTFTFRNFDCEVFDWDWDILTNFSASKTSKQKAIFVYKKLLSLSKYGSELKCFCENLKYQLYKKDDCIGVYSYVLCTRQTSEIGFIYCNIDYLYDFIKQHGINVFDNFLTFAFKNLHLIRNIEINSYVEITYFSGRTQTYDYGFVKFFTCIYISC